MIGITEARAPLDELADCEIGPDALGPAPDPDPLGSEVGVGALEGQSLQSQCAHFFIVIKRRGAFLRRLLGRLAS